MISSINSFVSKVVSTVSGPLHTWGPKAVRVPAKAVKASKKPVAAAKSVKKAAKAAKSAKCAAKCRKSARCRNKKCKCS